MYGMWEISMCSFFVTAITFLIERLVLLKASIHFFYVCAFFVVLFLRHLQVLRQNLILRSYCFGSYHTELFLN